MIQPDRYTNWVGIGGAGGDTKLLQNGCFTGHTIGTYPFYEALNGGIDTGTVPVTISGDPSNGVGDLFNIATNVDATGSATGGPVVTFQWHDLDTGAIANLGPYAEFYVGGSIYYTSTFYSGLSGEMIEERATVSGSLSTLRNYGSDAWTNSEVSINGGALSPIRSLAAHLGIDMYNDAGTWYSGVSGGATTDAFTDTFKTCGTEGT
ncbi:hypothetical protein SAMN05892883_1516 [Jatrophihabitans sp. GAS493]|nr:hypothetical protein SAMN05892883_1516 [Jatrophihabitans sp. GAS493]